MATHVLTPAGPGGGGHGHPFQAAATLGLDLFAALAHEMRGVLSPLKVATELLAEPVEFEPPDLARLMGTVYEGVRWLERLTDALTVCALLRQPNFALQPRPLDAADWVQPVIRLVSPLSARRGQQVRFSCSGPPPRVVGDARWLGHILLNLLSNAIRHGPPGDVIEVELTRCGGRVRLSVTDHGAGPGTEPEGSAGAEPCERMGIGLQVVRLLAALHGGEVGVGGRAGEYTVFWVELPAEDFDGEGKV